MQPTEAYIVNASQGKYNNYAAMHAYWSDTTDMDNLSSGNATGKASPGAMEINAKAHAGVGNIVHTYSSDGKYPLQNPKK
jgi:hypothetical protein